MAIEPERKCGYRKVGGLYIRGEASFSGCDRLPLAMPMCPVCGSSVKFTRSFVKIDPSMYFGEHKDCEDDDSCPICHPPRPYLEVVVMNRDGVVVFEGRAWEDSDKIGVVEKKEEPTEEMLSLLNEGLDRMNRENIGVFYNNVTNNYLVKITRVDHYIMWVGHKYYTVESFTEEAMKMGVSKRIPFIPNGMVPGKSVVYLAMKNCSGEIIGFDNDGKPVKKDCIFGSFTPTAFEYIMTESKATDSVIEEYKERGISVVVVPDNDPDHNPSKGSKKKKEPRGKKEVKESSVSLDMFLSETEEKE